MKIVQTLLSTLIGSSIAAPPALHKSYSAGNQCDPACVACLTLDRVYVGDKVEYDTTGGLSVFYQTRNFYVGSFSIDVATKYVCLDKVTSDDYVTELKFDEQGITGINPFGFTAYVNYTGSDVGGYPNHHFVDVFGGAVQSHKNYGLTTNLWLHLDNSNQFSQCAGHTRCPTMSTQQLTGDNGERSLADYNKTTSCPANNCDAWLVLNQAEINGIDTASNGKTCFKVQVSYYDNSGGVHLKKAYPVEVDNKKASQALKFPLTQRDKEFVSGITINKPNVCKGTEIDGFDIDTDDDWWLQSIEVVYQDNPMRFSDVMMTQGINEEFKEPNTNSSPQSLMRIGGTAPSVDSIQDSAFMMHGACEKWDYSTITHCQMFSSTFNFNYETAPVEA